MSHGEGSDAGDVRVAPYLSVRVCVSCRQQRALAGEACVSRMVVDKHIYLSKAGMPTVEVWDKRSERMVDCIDCAQIIRYSHLLAPVSAEHTGSRLYLQLSNAAASCSASSRSCREVTEITLAAGHNGRHVHN